MPCILVENVHFVCDFISKRNSGIPRAGIYAGDSLQLVGKMTNCPWTVDSLWAGTIQVSTPASGTAFGKRGGSNI